MIRVFRFLLAFLLITGTGYASQLNPPPKMQVFNTDGSFCSGCKLYTYETDAVTPKATYQDADNSVANTNPVVFNSRGEAVIFFDGEYYLELKDSSDVTIYTISSYGTASSTSTTDTNNLLANSSFETDDNGDNLPDSWDASITTGAAMTLTTADNRNGVNSLKITASAASGGGTVTSSNYLLVTQGRLYYASFAILCGTANNNFKYQVEWFTAAQTSISTSDLYDVTTTCPTSWTIPVVSVVAPSNARYAKVILNNYTGAPASDTLYLDDIRFTPVSGALLVSAVPGYKAGAVVDYAGTSTLTIHAGSVHTAGATEQIVKWSSSLTFTAGSGGSNAASSNLDASNDHYLYIDDSSVTPGTALTAANFLNSTTAPTWSESKHGYYNGNDRCIFVFMTNASSQIASYRSGDNGQILYDAAITDASGINTSTTWTDVTLTKPALCARAIISDRMAYVAGTPNFYWRTNGSAGTGYAVGYVDASTAQAWSQHDVISDASSIIEVRTDAAVSSSRYVYTMGYYLPEGM